MILFNRSQLRKLRYLINDPFLPQRIYPSDVFIVSYPKSGNTWMRFLIGNIMFPDHALNFNNLVKIIPEVGVDSHKKYLDELQHPRIIKSHATYRRKYPRVIYIVRDPRDVYISYFNYIRPSLSQDTTLSAFLRMKDIWPCRWTEHVDSWSDQKNVIYIRYEDLKENTYKQLEKILEFLNLNKVPPSRIEEAIRKSSFDHMKAMEIKHGRPFSGKSEREGKSPVFMRKGIVGDYKETLSETDINIISNECSDVARRYGYSL